MASQEPSLVARRIQEIRVAKKLSRQDLADLVGVTYLKIYRIEEGVTQVDVDDVPKFADALDVSVASLYRESKAAS